MPCLHNYNAKNQIYIYDAIMNAEYQNKPGPVFIWDPNNKVYKYGNTLPEKKNHKYITLFNPKSFMTRGDVICFGGQYRNERKMIFNGEKLEDLYTEIDDYGSVPPTYEVCDNGFNVGDFEDLIDHNSINWLSLKKLKEIKIFEKDNQVVGIVEIKGKLWDIDCYIHQEFEYNYFIRSLNNLKLTSENNQILFLDKSNINNIHKRNYVATLKNTENNVINIKDTNNLSIINSNNEWYIYKVDKEYKINKDNYGEPKLPCIFINNGKYKYEILLLNKEIFDTRINFEIKQNNESANWIIKEITCSPVTLNILKKSNETLIKEITDYIKDKIEKYDNIKERMSFSRSDNKTLELFL